MSNMELYFSCDVESDGPIPGPNSMLSFGCAIFQADNTTPLDTFSANLELLPNANPDPNTMKWWKAPEQREAWKACRSGLQPPVLVMPRFVDWVHNQCDHKKVKPVFVAYPAGYDFLFLYWYMMY